MNVKDPAGKNWAERRPRRRPWKLGQGEGRTRLPETLPPVGALEYPGAAGRNWAHDGPARRRRPAPGRPATRGPSMPGRERGGGDHDQPYRPAHPTAAAPFPFTAREFGRLLRLRGRLLDGALADDRRAAVGEEPEPEVSRPA
jgi:hypothetical protein